MPPVTIVAPPEREFYAKYLNCDGIGIRSSAAVDDKALRAMCGKVMVMPRHMPIEREVPRRRNAEVHIYGRAERMIDLPEFSHGADFEYLKGKGRGGYAHGGIGACPEESARDLPPEGRMTIGICVHEFAHVINFEGFSPVRWKLLESRYKASLAAGFWAGDYAGSNIREYWAEISARYFDDRSFPAPPRGGIGDGA